MGGDRPGGEGVRRFTCRVELPDRKLAPNGSHGHWAAKARLVKQYRVACAWAFAAAKPLGWKVAPVEIDVIYRHNKNSTGYRPRDVQNGIASCKATIDGMVDAGVIPNDSARWLKWGSFEIISRFDGEREGVYITVRAQ